MNSTENNRFKTKIFLDGGDPAETRRAKQLLGWLDGQTTNPSFIAKNLQQKGVKLTPEAALAEYKRIVQQMNKIVPDGSISIQVFANHETKAEEMLEQARERVNWISNASIKFPCITEGLKAAEVASKEMPINITLVFSQAQAAAVYEATKGAKFPVFISPFVGRLFDRGEAGMDLVRNILRMFCSRVKVFDSEDFDGELSRTVAQTRGARGSREYNTNTGSHVEVLAASFRTLDHILQALSVGANIITSKLVYLEEWVKTGLKIPGEDYQYNTTGLKPIVYDQSIKLGKPWQEYDISHPLTDKGLTAMWDDWNSLF